jgi:hypothetical protein
MYTSEILWLISWPLFIFVAYKLSAFAIKRYEAKQDGGVSEKTD